MKNKKLWIAVAVVVALIIAYNLLSSGKKEEKVSFDTAKVETGNIQTSITATGTIEPVTSVTVGTQVSGIVSHLYVDYNSVVKKGQVIAELDRTNLISELNAQKASLASAQSSLNYQQSNFERYKTLFEKGLVSADEFESARRVRVCSALRQTLAMQLSRRLSMVSCCRRLWRKARRWLHPSIPLSCSPLPRI